MRRVIGLKDITIEIKPVSLQNLSAFPILGKVAGRNRGIPEGPSLLAVSC